MEFDFGFHHHPLEFVQQGGLPGVVVRLELPLQALEKLEHPHLLLIQPQRWMWWKEDPLQHIQTVSRRSEGPLHNQGYHSRSLWARRPVLLLGLFLTEREVMAVLALEVQVEWKWLPFFSW